MTSVNYRAGVGMMVLKNAQEVLVGQRSDLIHDHCWQMPQGGIEKNEDPLKAALRELEEEMGIQRVRLITESQNWYFYDFPNPVTYKEGVFKGQTQKWYAFHFEGADSEINIHTIPPEFRCWQWMDIKKISNQVVTFKKDLYQQIIQEFQEPIEKFYQNLEKIFP